MTGFGVATAPFGDGRVLVEVRSLNHRYLDVRVRVPAEILEHGFFVEQLCRERFRRGRYDVSIRLEPGATSSSPVDIERARSTYLAFCELRDELAPGTEVPISILAGLPELLSGRHGLSPEQTRDALGQACADAIVELNRMRDQEGSSLQVELMDRLSLAREVCQQIMDRIPELLEAYRSRLHDRVARLLNDTGVSADPARLEQELALLADRTDVTEELARLRSHFDQFAAILERDDPVGRSLDFLLQEIAREANTIGSKCQDASLAHLVVELKSEIERLREQVQNVE